MLRAAERCGAAALDRAWGRRGWQRLAALATGRDGVFTVAAPQSDAPLTDAPVTDPLLTDARAAAGAPPPDPETRARARALLAGSHFAALLRAARLRPAEPTAAAWAVLVLAETDPAVLHRPAAHAGLHRLLTEALRAPDRAPARPEPMRPRRRLPSDGPTAPSDSGVPPGRGRQAETREAEPRIPGAAPAAPRRGAPPPDAADEHAPVRTPRQGAGPEPGPGPVDGVPTDWAGLLFLLATAAAAGLPDRALDEPAFAARPLPWVLHAAARALVPAAAPDDPALLALAGLGRARAARVLNAPPATPTEQARINALAADWAKATATRLGGTGEDSAPGAAAEADAGRALGAVPAPPGEQGRIDALAAAASGAGAAVPGGAGEESDPGAAAEAAGAGWGPGAVPATVGERDGADVPAADGAQGSGDRLGGAAERPDPGGAVAAATGPGRVPDTEAAEPGGPERTGDAAAVVARVVRRRGRILAEPGWIEAVLAVGDTDLDVRRAGLDLDPGWVGWLGAVVRYRYV